MNPGHPRLAVQPKKGAGDPFGIDSREAAIGSILFARNRAVDRDMRDVDSLGSKLARHALREAPQATFCRGKTRVLR